MAAPHVAGAAALVRQLHPEWSGQAVAAALAGRSRPLPGEHLLVGGAGRLDAAAAAEARVVALPWSVSLGLADVTLPRIEQEATVNLLNVSDQSVAVTVQAETGEGAGAQVTAQPEHLTLGPGEQAGVQVRIALERPDRDADVWGHLAVNIDGEVHTRVPFYLPIRFLQAFVTPDPAIDDTEVFVWSPAPLADNPVVTVHGPDGSSQSAMATPAGSFWWRAPVNHRGEGLYRVEVGATAQPALGSVGLVGAAAFEGMTPAGPGNRGAVSWQPVGPNSLGGPVLFDPSNHRRIRVLGQSNGVIFLSENNGETWREIRNFPVAGGSPLAVLAHPTDSRRLLLAINGGNQDPTYRGRLLRSTDGGNTWTTLPFPDLSFDDLQRDPVTGTVAAFSQQRVFLSQDEGETWVERALSVTQVLDRRLYGGHLYLATRSGLYRMRDVTGGGDQTELIYHPGGILPWVDRVATDGRVILAQAYFGGLHASHDGGQTWQRLANLPPSAGRFQNLRLENGEVMGATLGAIWIGRNYGAEWVQWPKPVNGSLVRDLLRRPGPGRGQDGGIMVSDRAGLFAVDGDDPVTYRRVGVPGIDIAALAAVEGPDGPALLAATYWDVYRTPLPGREAVNAEVFDWGFSGREAYVGVTVRAMAVAPSNPGLVYKVVKDAFSRFHVHRSEDGGLNWALVVTEQEMPYAILIHPADPDRVYISYWSLTGSGILFTHNGGRSWMKHELGRVTLALAGDPSNPDRLWAGDGTGLYRSDDGGFNFRQLQSVPVSAITADPGRPGRLVIGGRELYASEDGGVTLQEAVYADLSIYVSAFAFDPEEPNVVYAALGGFFEAGLRKGGRGVIRSDDGGRTWRQFSRLLVNRDVTSLAITPDGHLYAGTLGGGVYRIKLAGEPEQEGR